MRIYSNPDGSIMAAVRSIDVGAPTSASTFHESRATASLDIDETTNEATANAIDADSRTFRLAAGVLTQNGVAVVIAAPGRAVRDREFAMERLAELESDATLTLNQIGRVLRFILRWIIRHS